MVDPRSQISLERLGNLPTSLWASFWNKYVIIWVLDSPEFENSTTEQFGEIQMMVWGLVLFVLRLLESLDKENLFHVSTGESFMGARIKCMSLP